MNKKGTLIFEIAIWILRILMVIVIIMGVALQIRSYIDVKVNLYYSEPALIMQIVGNSPAFLYQDLSGNYARAVSVERFKLAEPLLNAAFYYRQRHATAKVSITETDGTVIKAIFLNPDYYDELYIQKSILGGKAVTGMSREWPVMLVEKDKMRKGMISVEVLQPV
jgi:hypothetical protein